MKINYFQLLLILISGTAFGQTLSNVKQSSNPPTAVELCSQQAKMNEMMINDPERYANIGLRSTKPHQEHYTPPVQEKVTGVVYTIPVVFHILHNGGTENISDAQILDAFNILNRDYRKLNADANSVVAAFQGMPADVEVEFKLARVAPDGTCFDGITRTQSSATSSSNGQTQVAAIVNGNNVYQGVWPHNRYLNIYVCRSIGGAAGYTFLPNGGSTANETNMYYNGIFILHNYVGSIGTSNENSSRALTHEVGHWLNLPHTWGAGNNPGSSSYCNDDDGIQDTPNTVGATSCNLSANTCTTDNAYWGFNQIDNVENYMDYSYCSKMFTQGQVDEMRAALEYTNSSFNAGRYNIWQTANLQLVGAIPGSSLCSIDFEANETVVCAGTTVTYTPNTTTGISQYSWSFPGGNPTSSNLQSPTVTYNTPGTHNATLVVTSSANGSNYTESKTTYITVNNNTTISLPITEGFTNTGTPAGWTIVNQNNSTTTWTRTTAAGNTPTTGNSFMFDNANYDDSGDTDQFQITKFSTVGMSSAELTFDVAYAPYNATYFDGLEVMVSTDCGSTFTSVYLKTGTTLATRTATTNVFTPTAAQWRNETIDLTPYVGESSVLVSFKNLAGYGNRLFVDNINITGVTSAPTADFTASLATACTSQSLTFTDASVGATSWTWDFGVGATPPNATGAGPHSVTYSSGGTKTITLTINGGSTASETINVTGVPSAPTINAGGPTTFCAGGSVVLTSSAASGNVWSTGATTQSITVSAGGSYTVTTTNGTACTSAPSAATVVTVNPLPATPAINAGGPTSFCAGGNVVLTSSSATGNIWSNGATTQSTTVSTSNTYTVSVNNGTCISNASAPVTVTVTTTPSTPTINASGPTTFCAGGSVVLSSSSPTLNTWSNGATTQSITVTAGNTYTVTAGNTGCSATSSPITVTVNPLPTVTFGALSTLCVYNSPITLTQGSPAGGTYSGAGVSGGQFNPTTAGNGTHTLTYSYTDGNNCTNTQNSSITVDGCLGIEEQDESFISIFPNPSNGIFTLKSGNYKVTSVSVYNHLGQMILDQKSNLNEQEINLTNFSDGIYTIRVNHESGIENLRVILNK